MTKERHVAHVLNHVLPVLTENLRYVGVMHVRTCLENFSTLVLSPDHESVHRPLDVWLVLAFPFLLSHHFRCS